MVAVCEQGYWMLKVYYHVVSSDTGCVRCLATVGPTLDAKFCHGLFGLLFSKTYPMHLLCKAVLASMHYASIF